MKTVINKAAVLGAGVMGAGIAALLAGIGVQVALMDIVPPKGLTDEEKAKGLTEQSPAFRNKFAEAGLKNIKNPRNAMLFSKGKAANLKIGNLTDNLDYLEEADWIIEVVVERLDVKKGVMKTIGEHCKPNAIITSNTSGVSITKIVEDMDDAFKARFMGTHFFNPPRWMGLFEMIPTKWTSEETIETMADFGANQLGKTVVYAKDTPNFVGNRIGVYAAIQVMHLTEKYGYDLQTADLLSGPVMGHPKSATFKTADLVGLDILANVSNNVLESSNNDVEKAQYALPQYVQDLVAGGALGDKVKHGFFKKDVIEGKKAILTWNPKTGAYEAIKAMKFDSVAAALATKNKYEAMAYGETEECKFYWEAVKAVLLYAAALVPEIADDFREIDKAICSGFNWEVGPFQTWDKIGVKKAVEKMQAEGDVVPKWVLDMLASGKETFYDASAKSDGFIVLKGCNVIKENSDASVRDIGDGVLCLEIHSKGNAITVPAAEMMAEAAEMLHDKQWNGMVVGNNGKNFSAGADLAEILKAAQEKRFDDLGGLVRLLQTGTQALKYAVKPVVAAPFGAAYGGGCEVVMHCRSTVPFIETNMGLVETGVGLIPAGGGCTELTIRALKRCYNSSKKAQYDAIRDVWKNIMTANVNLSAYAAIEAGYIDNCYVEMRREKLLDSAKKQVLYMADHNYHPPVEDRFKVMGDYAKGAILSDIEFMRGGGNISDHDVVIGKAIANIICGGNLPVGTEIRAQQMLDLEREAFLSLAGTQKTQDRIIGMLTTGKPVRN
ncbi:MAG: 3-hydroxyacyl-CoA dehydrogenase/enoyl-CoA hydratase family protein, partial [Oscillospiraceae bacterium]